MNGDDERTPHPTLSQPWGDPDYDPSCPDCREGRHGRRRMRVSNADALAAPMSDDAALRTALDDAINRAIEGWMTDATIDIDRVIAGLKERGYVIIAVDDSELGSAKV